MATSKEMTAGPALPLILKFTLPLLLGNLLQQTYSLVDAAIVGKFLGINALASVGASTSVVFLILGFCNGCCGGFGIPVAQKFGARDYSTMRSYVAVSLKLAAGMSVVIALLTCILCEDILRIMRTPENIFEGAYEGLVLAEVEFQNQEDAENFAAPEWFGEDVTFSGEYQNSRLSAGR